MRYEEEGEREEGQKQMTKDATTVTENRCREIHCRARKMDKSFERKEGERIILRITLLVIVLGKLRGQKPIQ